MYVVDSYRGNVAVPSPRRQSRRGPTPSRGSLRSRASRLAYTCVLLDKRGVIRYVIAHLFHDRGNVMPRTERARSACLLKLPELASFVRSARAVPLLGRGFLLA